VPDFVFVTMTILEKRGIKKTVNETVVFRMLGSDIIGFEVS
jgi:hypothetical protein